MGNPVMTKFFFSRKSRYPAITLPESLLLFPSQGARPVMDFVACRTLRRDFSFSRFLDARKKAQGERATHHCSC